MTLFHLGVWVCILCLASALLGYRAGRRAGRREGWGKAAVMTPLILRRQAWRTGRCPVCGFAANLQPERLQAEGGRVPVSTHEKI
ncbi:hypothetical protein GCM10010885_11900 [Alicyclobacillus cellulosilyticus]|uniref:Uncharacterized protein n=1 Tax=Alicyclobacillus cellulosilyticus TaxID=1003997 RepID=A0A917NJ21_9BACL|nr:hypothetical protein [Alicyclobacillus cellulosilyticus]GGJ04245.1 hypothetical protein GCM10010885_11900 [Alicyclobacillus cellulosilyticus]